MRTRKLVEITIETDRLVVVRGRKISAVAWCGSCNQRVKMTTVDEAATIAGVSPRTVYRWIEAGKLHSMETSERVLLVCLDSLMTIVVE